MAGTFEPLSDYDVDIEDEHVSDKVFEGLDDDIQPVQMEWGDEVGFLIMGCGCRIMVHPGDTVWSVIADDGVVVPIALDPVTIH